MKIIFQIDGGIGKSIAATAVCKAIKKNYPADELIVITGYPEVFLCNKNVNKALNFNELRYFYEEHISGHQYRILAHNPYLETSFIKGDTHLIEVWCGMFGIPYNGELPELFLNSREQTFFRNQFAAQNLFASGKPLLLQTNGGGKDQPNKYSWPRDIPNATAQKIVDAFTNEYNVVHIRRDDQLTLNNVTPVTADFRPIFALIQLSAKRLFMDSFCQHAAAALGMPSVVCFIDDVTRTHFGYDIHTNIMANPPTIAPELRHSIYSRYNITGATPTEFPYNHEGEVYDSERIIEAVKNTPVAAQAVTVQAPVIVGAALENKNGVHRAGKRRKKEMAA